MNWNGIALAAKTDSTYDFLRVHGFIHTFSRPVVPTRPGHLLGEWVRVPVENLSSIV